MVAPASSDSAGNAHVSSSQSSHGTDGMKISAPEDALPPLRLEDISPVMQQACARAGWSRLMPVQAHSLPYLLAERHMMIQSRTGSGKTGAYLLPLLDKITPDVKAPQTLVLVPTRELAIQVEHEAQVLLEGSGLNVAAVYGGVGYGKQLDALRKGVQVLVGTPGRVLDHLLRRTLSLEALRVLIFDEADRMLSIGFYPDMKEIQRYLPKRPILSTLFSATYPPHVLKLAEEFLRKPQILSLSQGRVHVAETQHLYCECRGLSKDRVLVRLLETENPDSAIIFCNTKANVHYVTGVLQGFGYNADELSADLSQNKREDVLDRLRKGKIRLLVATDVAARGIDIPALSHVILYEPPDDRESYIHRAGRTGRAGAVGTVVSLVDIMEKLELERIARFYKIELIALPAPTDEDVSKVVGQRVTALLEGQKRDCTGLQLERARRFLPLAKEMLEDEEQLLLLALLLDAQYQNSLSAESSGAAEPSAKRPTREDRHAAAKYASKYNDSPEKGRSSAQEARPAAGPKKGEAQPARADNATDNASDAIMDGSDDTQPRKKKPSQPRNSARKREDAPARPRRKPDPAGSGAE